MHQFLKWVSKRFEVIIFTASQRAYADKVLDRIDVHKNMIK